ncbi:MAG: DUF488 family protein [Bacteroidota bacterium]|nr:DUF488 family protein [Bacteroidota bacterium]MDP4215653.1 DUF488 family protein [Bacteroidota bacterium]MDP4246532.1 DUF488 family protein [Bacteroidota bacterium]MDP4252919.1 DUF488 family protein [Bacteroidota bacterium]MDP4259767.1 DUF488 family protein [Bacteroidota bacterium]
MNIKVKRIYEPYATGDGYRILVDRLWPRGIKKENAHIDKWLKEVAPSTELRKWIHADPDRWTGFKTKYRAELTRSAALKELSADVRAHQTVTLLYAVRDEQHNHALILREVILDQQAT